MERSGFGRARQTLALGWAAVALAAGLTGCKEHRNIVFLVDTSGSMRHGGLMDDTKASMKKILQNYGPGDRVYLVTFDADPRVITDRVIEDPIKDRAELAQTIDALDARGKWTDLVGAMDASLDYVARLQKSQPGSHTAVVLYTDGRHDPPPERKAQGGIQDFDGLVGKYYKDYKKGESWFIYYVELAESEPALRTFLDKTGSGVVVGREALRRAEGFMDMPILWKLPLFLSLLGVLVLGLWTFVVLPRLRGVSFVPMQPGADPARAPSRIRLESFRAGTMQRLMGVGKASDIQITVAGTKVDVSVDSKGKYYLQVPTGAGVQIDGMPITGRAEIRVGQKLKFGRSEYVFSRNRRKDGAN
ncbi:MAG TPA: VWA domain-containing protein [Bdellovibrionota bacterium]|nr:VWA domain-containing protein [Bdellovibrionota bacterium]